MIFKSGEGWITPADAYTIAEGAGKLGNDDLAAEVSEWFRAQCQPTTECSALEILQSPSADINSIGIPRPISYVLVDQLEQAYAAGLDAESNNDSYETGQREAATTQVQLDQCHLTLVVNNYS